MHETPRRKLLVPPGSFGVRSAVHAVPFQASATVPAAPPAARSPVAVHAVAETHETLNRLTPLACGVGSSDQVPEAVLAVPAARATIPVPQPQTTMAAARNPVIGRRIVARPVVCVVLVVAVDTQFGIGHA